MQELVNTTENNVHEMPKRGSKRKALTLDQNFIIQGAMLEPLDIQDLVLSCDKLTSIAKSLPESFNNLALGQPPLSW